MNASACIKWRHAGYQTMTHPWATIRQGALLSFVCLVCFVVTSHPRSRLDYAFEIGEATWGVTDEFNGRDCGYSKCRFRLLIGNS